MSMVCVHVEDRDVVEDLWVVVAEKKKSFISNYYQLAQSPAIRFLFIGQLPPSNCLNHNQEPNDQPTSSGHHCLPACLTISS